MLDTISCVIIPSIEALFKASSRATSNSFIPFSNSCSPCSSLLAALLSSMVKVAFAFSNSTSFCCKLVFCLASSVFPTVSCVSPASTSFSFAVVSFFNFSVFEILLFKSSSLAFCSSVTASPNFTSWAFSSFNFTSACSIP